MHNPDVINLTHDNDIYVNHSENLTCRGKD